MLIPLVKPSLIAIRAYFVQEKLQEATQQQHKFVRIAATGRAGSGKATLGNCLIGADYFLRSDDHQDRTNVVSIIQFPDGLEYVDLPASSGDEQCENPNRAALGLPQISTCPQVDTLTLATYDQQRNRVENTIAVTQAGVQTLRPDFIFYLVAPHQKLLPHEQAYIVDLLHSYKSDQILYIFNLFTHQEQNSPVTTLQEIEDARAKIASAYQQAGCNGKADTRIIEVNGWTGQGITELLAGMRSALRGEKGALFVELIEYQRQKTPAAYIQALKQELLRFFAEVVFEKGSDTGAHPLISYLQSLTDFLSSLNGQTVIVSDTLQASLTTLINEIAENCTQTITEASAIAHPQRIYENVPVYKEIEEPDYSKPIYKEETEYISESYWDDTDDPLEFIQSIFDGNIGRKKKWRRKIEKTQSIIGYKKKVRRVLDGYEAVYSHTVYSDEPASTHTVNTFYHPVGYYGIALLAAFCNIVVAHTELHRENTIEALYTKIVVDLQEPLANCHMLSANQVAHLLKMQMSVLFRSSFDQDIISFLHIW